MGSSRCAGLLAWSKEEAALGGAPAARGCWIQTGGGCFRGSSRCAGLLDWRNAAAAFGGAPAARGCSLGEMQRLLLGELSLRGAARLEKCSGCFWGSSRCAGLLAWSKEEAALGGAPAARGCSIGEMQRLLQGELPLRGAARLEKGGGCFWGSSRCAGLLDTDRRRLLAASGGAPAARGCWITDMRRLLLGGAFAARGCSIGEMQRLLLRELPLRGAARLE